MEYRRRLGHLLRTDGLGDFTAFIYNADAFNELGLEEPETYEDFLAMLQTIRDSGVYEPLVMGTADQWEGATMGYQNIGPNYWNGEEGSPSAYQRR